MIRQAAAAHHYLAVFDNHTACPLYLGRSRRLASAAQRIVLYARDRGCTQPGCTKPAYHSQAHHDDGWAVADSPTDIDKLSLACGPDNRLIEETGWTTRKRKDGRTEWIPPPQLDTGQARVNNYHHPERYLMPDDNDDPQRRPGLATAGQHFTHTASITARRPIRLAVTNAAGHPSLLRRVTLLVTS